MKLIYVIFVIIDYYLIMWRGIFSVCYCFLHTVFEDVCGKGSIINIIIVIYDIFIVCCYFHSGNVHISLFKVTD